MSLSILVLSAVIIVTLTTSLSYSQSQTNSTTSSQIAVFSADSKPYGLTYSEWTAKWWQWSYSVPKDVNPAYDDSGKYCAEGQSGLVWFLTSTYKHPVDRYCTIPAGKAILFTILNSECSYAEFHELKTEKQLRQCSKEMQDSVTQVQASVDGISIKDLDKYRTESPLFSFTLPENNILGLHAHITTQSVSDGNWVFLKPLSMGKHIIYFKGGLRNIINTSAAKNNNNNTSSTNFTFAGPYGWDYPTTYHITVANSSPSSPTTSIQAAPSGLQSNNITTTTGSLASDKKIELKLLANGLESRLNKSAAILELTSKLPEVKSVPYSNSISPKLHGIPKDVDISERKVAQSILSVDKDFRVVFFLMPNGDIYLDEPYSLQANLTKNNFAYRDYYKGAINTHDTYIGNVVISNSTGLPTPFMSVPIYSSVSGNNDHNGTLIGIWAGGLNLKVFSKYLQSLNLTNNNNNERIVFVDQYGHKIADSDKRLATNYNESFANLQGFKNAIAGKSGSTIEVVNGSKTMIFYYPVKFHSTTWAILLMRQS